MHLQTSEAFAEGQAGPGTLESDSERHVSSPHIAHGTLLDDSESHRTTYRAAGCGVRRDAEAALRAPAPGSARRAAAAGARTRRRPC